MCALCSVTKLPLCEAGGVCDPSFHQVMSVALLSLGATAGSAWSWLTHWHTENKKKKPSTKEKNETR